MTIAYVCLNYYLITYYSNQLNALNFEYRNKNIGDDYNNFLILVLTTILKLPYNCVFIADYLLISCCHGFITTIRKKILFFIQIWSFVCSKLKLEIIILRILFLIIINIGHSSVWKMYENTHLYRINSDLRTRRPAALLT